MGNGVCGIYVRGNNLRVLINKTNTIERRTAYITTLIFNKK